MLCDYDPYTGWGGNNYVNNGPVPEPITGNYSRFKIAKEDAADWEWSGTVAIAQIGVNYWDDVKANQDNYQLKFEVNTLTALSKRQIRFFLNKLIMIGNLLLLDSLLKQMVNGRRLVLI